MKLKYYLPIFLAVFCQAGCKAKYLDVSDSEKFSEIVNQDYEVTDDLHVIGGYWGNKGGVDFYLIYTKNKVGGGGPGVSASFELPIGTILRVVKILKCKNCFLEAPLHAEIELIDSFANVKKEIPISLADNDFFVETPDSGFINLDRRVFKKL